LTRRKSIKFVSEYYRKQYFKIKMIYLVSVDSWTSTNVISHYNVFSETFKETNFLHLNLTDIHFTLASVLKINLKKNLCSFFPFWSQKWSLEMLKKFQVTVLRYTWPMHMSIKTDLRKNLNKIISFQEQDNFDCIFLIEVRV
jgi:hypothetical protein